MIVDYTDPREDESFSIAAFYDDNVLCIIAIPDDNDLNCVLISTCPADVAWGSGIKDSYMTAAPLSHSRTLHKKTSSSDLLANFLSDELLVVKLAPLRRIPTVKTLDQAGPLHRGPSSESRARVMYQLTKFTGAAARVFQRLGLHNRA